MSARRDAFTILVASGQYLSMPCPFILGAAQIPQLVQHEKRREILVGRNPELRIKIYPHGSDSTTVTEKIRVVGLNPEKNSLFMS